MDQSNDYAASPSCAAYCLPAMDAVSTAYWIGRHSYYNYRRPETAGWPGRDAPPADNRKRRRAAKAMSRKARERDEAKAEVERLKGLLEARGG